MDASTSSDSGGDAALPSSTLGFRDLCTATMGTIIEDGNPAQSAAGAMLATTLSSACGATPNVRTVQQGDTGVLDLITRRPLLGPDDLAFVGDRQYAQDVMRYLSKADTPVVWTNTSTTHEFYDRLSNTLILSIPQNQIDGSHDIGVIEITHEPIGGTVVLTAFGLTADGAMAASVYYREFRAAGIVTDTNAYYVVSWANGDADPAPTYPGDTFTLLGSGP